MAASSVEPKDALWAEALAAAKEEQRAAAKVGELGEPWDAQRAAEKA